MGNEVIVNDLVGKQLYGFCNGYFDRDSYDDKVIIMNGINWVVAMPNEGFPEIATFNSNVEMMGWVKRNSDISQQQE